MAVNDAFSTTAGTPLHVGGLGVLANDTGTALTVFAPGTFATTLGGSVTILSDGTFTYTDNGVGDDTFTYQNSDGTSQSSTATVTIHVA